MATKSAELRDDLAAQFATSLTTGADGMTLNIYDGATLLASFTGLGFASGATGVQSVSGVPITVQAVATGTADGAEVESDEATPRTVTGLTIGTSGTQVILDNLSINSGQDVTLISFSYTETATIN